MELEQALAAAFSPEPATPPAPEAVPQEVPQAPEFIQVNEPEMGMVMQPQPMTDEMGQPVIDPATGQPAVQMIPAIGVVGVKNRLAELDMDIIVDTVPDQISLQQEVWGEIMQLVGSTGQGLAAVFTPEFELMIQASPLADKARVIEHASGAEHTPIPLAALLVEHRHNQQPTTFPISP